MKNKCLNYKFIYFMVYPLGGITFSVFFYLIRYNGFSLFLFLISLLSAILLLCFEPILYNIRENEITIICAFKQYHFFDREIQRITLICDDFFDSLWVKDYVLTLDERIKIPKRCRRIIKSPNTKKCIEKYFKEKMKLY